MIPVGTLAKDIKVDPCSVITERRRNGMSQGVSMLIVRHAGTRHDGAVNFEHQRLLDVTILIERKLRVVDHRTLGVESPDRCDAPVIVSGVLPARQDRSAAIKRRSHDLVPSLVKDVETTASDDPTTIDPAPRGHLSLVITDLIESMNHRAIGVKLEFLDLAAVL